MCIFQQFLSLKELFSNQISIVTKLYFVLQNEPYLPEFEKMYEEACTVLKQLYSTQKVRSNLYYNIKSKI